MKWRVSQIPLDAAIIGTNGEPFAAFERPTAGVVVLVKQLVEEEGGQSSVPPQQRPAGY